MMNVLITDDSAAVRKILRRLIEQTQLPFGNIYEASDGLEALRCVRFKSVDLILSDINMPNMDGLELLRRLKRNAEWSHIPVIMITTEGGQTRVVSALQLGASGYIRKPFNAEHVQEKL